MINFKKSICYFIYEVNLTLFSTGLRITLWRVSNFPDAFLTWNIVTFHNFLNCCSVNYFYLMRKNILLPFVSLYIGANLIFFPQHFYTKDFEDTPISFIYAWNIITHIFFNCYFAIYSLLCVHQIHSRTNNYGLKTNDLK